MCFSVFLFVIIVLLLAFDFWTVKNVSGRLLCGLRWWNETGPDGESVWVFESADVSLPQPFPFPSFFPPLTTQRDQNTLQPQRQINATDSKVFWIALYSFPVLWLLLALVAILKFEFVWLTVVGISPFLPPVSLS